MNVNYLSFPSYWGREVRHKYLSNTSSSLVVVFPGKNYSCDLPLLYYAGRCAVEAGHDALLLEYGYQSARTDLDIDKLKLIIQECLVAVQQMATQYSNIIFVSKSLGTAIAGEVAKIIGYDRIQHVYLTPLESTVAHIQNSKGIVIYGTNDSLFNDHYVRSIEHVEDMKVYPIANANHSLELDNTKESIAIMSKIIEKYTNFFEMHKPMGRGITL